MSHSYLATFEDGVLKPEREEETLDYIGAKVRLTLDLSGNGQAQLQERPAAWISFCANGSTPTGRV